MMNNNIKKSLWDRFHDKAIPEPNTGCWIWLGAVKELGYGVIGLGTRKQGTAKAHRVSYMLYKGEIPNGLSILHSCDNPWCVNPDHLRAGTLSDNMKDCVARKRHFIPNNKGENAKWAKLNKEDVLHIRQKLMTGIQYAKLYNVSKSSIYQIWNGTNWKSI